MRSRAHTHKDQMCTKLHLQQWQKKSNISKSKLLCAVFSITASYTSFCQHLKVWSYLHTTLTCSLLVEEMLDSASSCRSSVRPFHVRPSRRKRWCSSSSSHAFFQLLLRFTCSCCTFTEISWMLSEGIQALRSAHARTHTQTAKQKQPNCFCFKLY